jgi:hypothetical protein
MVPIQSRLQTLSGLGRLSTSNIHTRRYWLLYQYIKFLVFFCFSIVDDSEESLTHHLPADCVTGCFLQDALGSGC